MSLFRWGVKTFVFSALVIWLMTMPRASADFVTAPAYLEEQDQVLNVVVNFANEGDLSMANRLDLGIQVDAMLFTITDVNMGSLPAGFSYPSNTSTAPRHLVFMESRGPVASQIANNTSDIVTPYDLKMQSEPVEASRIKNTANFQSAPSLREIALIPGFGSQFESPPGERERSAIKHQARGWTVLH